MVVSVRRRAACARLCSRKREWARTELGEENSFELAHAVTELASESGYTVTVDDPVADEPHGSGRHVAATVPLR